VCIHKLNKKYFFYFYFSDKSHIPVFLANIFVLLFHYFNVFIDKFNNNLHIVKYTCEHIYNIPVIFNLVPLFHTFAGFGKRDSNICPVNILIL